MAAPTQPSPFQLPAYAPGPTYIHNTYRGSREEEGSSSIGRRSTTAPSTVLSTTKDQQTLYSEPVDPSLDLRDFIDWLKEVRPREAAKFEAAFVILDKGDWSLSSVQQWKHEKWRWDELGISQGMGETLASAAGKWSR